MRVSATIFYLSSFISFQQKGKTKISITRAILPRECSYIFHYNLFQLGITGKVKLNPIHASMASHISSLIYPLLTLFFRRVPLVETMQIVSTSARLASLPSVLTRVHRTRAS
jgi:hypothetical protein